MYEPVSGAMARARLGSPQPGEWSSHGMWLVVVACSNGFSFLSFASNSLNPSSNMREVGFEFEIVPETIDGDMFLDPEDPECVCEAAVN